MLQKVKASPFLRSSENTLNLLLHIAFEQKKEKLQKK